MKMTLALLLIIEHVRVFDGTTVIANTNVVVENGVIRAVGAKVQRSADAEADLRSAGYLATAPGGHGTDDIQLQ